KVNLLLPATLLVVALITLKTFAQDSTETYLPEINITMKQVPEGLTANDVIDNYFEAIGGKEKFSKVEDRTTIMRAEIMGQNLSIVINQKAPNKLKQSIGSGEIKQSFGIQTIEMNVSSVKLNKGLEDSVFEIPE
ncbi:MAG: hypothetical protein IH795_08280, partial [Bacteroidetes bacterium]|nr:hypothetical protein [Bacteroidota bacterium]